MSSSKIFPALSVVSLAVAGAAIVISQPADPTPIPEMRAAPDVDVRELERRIGRLTAELIALQGEVEALRAARAPAPGAGQDEADVALAALGNGETVPAALEGRIAEAVDEAIEQREAKQRAAKARGAREGMAEWVDSRIDRLPTLYDRISETMALPVRTSQEIEDIFANTFETMATLTDQLYADPPPTEERAYEIMGEAKGAVGTMVGQLDEILTADELIALGQVTVDSEMPSVGRAILEEGKNDHAGEHPGEDSGSDAP